MATHYELLGLTPSASPEEVRAAYRALARRYHPDTQHDVDAATAARSRQTMAALNAAWAVLGDPARRRAYDTSLGRPQPAPRPMGQPNRPSWDWQPLPDDTDDPDGLDDQPYGDPRPRRPSDSFVMAPVILVLAAAGLFFLSTMVQSSLLRTTAVLLLPVAGVGFVAAPLFVMVRGRSRP